MSSKNEKRALTTAEAATYCSVSIGFLRQSRVNSPSAKNLSAPKFTKLGRKKVVYLREHLDVWLDESHESS